MKTARRAWHQYQQRHRVVDPLVLVAIALGLTMGWDCAAWESATRSVALYAAIAGVAGTLLGFVITTMALLLGLLPQAEFRALRRHRDYGAVFAEPKFAVGVLGVTTLFALGATVAAAAQVHNLLILGFTLGLVGWSSAAVMHATRILWLAVRIHVNAERDF